MNIFFEVNSSITKRMEDPMKSYMDETKKCYMGLAGKSNPKGNLSFVVKIPESSRPNYIVR